MSGVARAAAKVASVGSVFALLLPPALASGQESSSGPAAAWLGRLAEAGITAKLQATDDLLGNPTGGRAQGATLEGGMHLSLEADLGERLGLEGSSARIDGYGVYGRGLSARNIDNINLVSSIEALRSVWLYEAWVQQAVPDGRADLRVGQLGADTEFLITHYGGWFVNTAFGWPSLPSVDLPSGGPAYPLATPGARFRLKPSDRVTLLIALFNGDPAGPGLDNPQRRDPHGTSLRLGDGAYAIGEAQYAIAAGDMPTTIKVGAWYHDKATPNGYFADDGHTSLSGGEASGIARRNASLYAVVDASLFPGPGGKGGLGSFMRVSVAPPDRSKVSGEAAAGLTYDGPFGRVCDRVGIGVTSIRVGTSLGSGVAASRYVFKGYETVLEATYDARLSATLHLQPDLQYVFHPGGGIPDPSRPWREVGNAAVIGLRAVESF